MTDINRVILVGRVVKDAELKFTPSSTPVTRFSVAVNRSRKNGDQWEEEVSYIDIVLWGRSAESISKFLIKYRNHPSVENVFSTLRPAVVGLLAAAALLLMNSENFSSMSENPWRFCLSIFLFVFALIAQKVYRLGPILIIVLCGLAGIVLGL